MDDSNKMQSMFLDNMSHELRTPITVILGYAGILYEELEDPDLKEMAEIILKSSNRLTESLNLLLDQSEIVSNNVDVELEETEMNSKLKETTNLYKPVALDKNLSISFESSLDKVFCKIDAKMFDKIMTNLLNNAIKFTEQGNIKILLEPVNNNGIEKVKIDVSDTGIGISEEKQSLIFEAFRQVSEGMNRLYQGTGLGLSVTKKFVELMNGEITVKSKLEQGTTFSLIFPKVK